jgi:hypothetical protein
VAPARRPSTPPARTKDLKVTDPVRAKAEDFRAQMPQG